MTFIQKTLHRLDTFQQQHSAVGFPLAVQKKYGEDQAGYRAALLTYYGFLSLFPLLLVLTSVLRIVLQHNPAVRQKIINSAYSYFPVVGTQLQHNIHGLGKNGIALVIGLILTFYGAKSVADAFRSGVNHVWQVPRDERTKFPLSTLKSFAVIIVGGAGLILAMLVAGYSTKSGNAALSVLAVIISLIILFGLFSFLIKISLAVPANFKKLWIGAAVIAVALEILQVAGGYLVTHQLKHLDSLYGTFAVVLGLLFWIYLQAQVIFYALEIDSIRAFRLWPRGMVAETLTPADKRAFGLYVKRSQFVEHPKSQAAKKR